MKFSAKLLPLAAFCFLVMAGTLILFSLPPSPLSAFVGTFRNEIIFAALFGGGLFFFSIFLFTIRLTISLRKLKNAAEAIGAGGEKVVVEVASTDEIGELAGAFNRMSDDVSSARSELLAEKSFTEAVMSSLTDVMVIMGPGGAIRYANPAATALTGYSESELSGKNVSEIISDAHLIEAYAARPRERKSRGDLETSLIRHGGERIPVSLSLGPLYDLTSGFRKFTGVVCVARDMRGIYALIDDLKRSKKKMEEYSHTLEEGVRQRTGELMNTIEELRNSRRVLISVLEDSDEARKKLEIALKEVREKDSQLLHAEKLSGIGVMAAGVAHEINNPLVSILGYSQLMMMRKDIDASMRQDLQNIERESKRCVGIIENLLNFARPAKPRMARIQVGDVLETTLQMVEYSVRRQQVEIIRKFDPSLPSIHGDEHQLQQVFLNMILNAANAMTSGGSLTIKTERLPGKGMIAILFSDTGHGISEGAKERIFEPFFTTAYEKGRKGTGLGLSISHSIITSHGGEISFESIVGQGTTFQILLPIAKEG